MITASFQLPRRKLPWIARVMLYVVAPAWATAALPLAVLLPVWGNLAGGLAFVALIGALGWGAARAAAGQGLIEVAFVTVLVTALLVPGGGSALIAASLSIARYRFPICMRAANDNDRSPGLGWMPITPARARALLAQSAIG